MHPKLGTPALTYTVFIAFYSWMYIYI